MKRLLYAALAGALGLALASPAAAADLPRKAPIYAPPPIVAPVFTWSGFYVGINGGYGWGKADLSNAFGSRSFDVKGGLVGATVGYNIQTGVWVWGVEGDIDVSWIKGSDNGLATICTFGCEAKNTWLGTVRGRVGYAFDRWMPYFTGGAAFGGVKAGTFSGVTTNKTQFGWTLGAGVEYAFLGPWSTKIEYLFTDLGRFTCDAATCLASTDVKFKTNLIRAGLNYRF